MQTYMRWSAILVALMLALAACQQGGDTSDPSVESEPAPTDGGGEDPQAVCDADAVGCVEIPSGDPIRIASALSITGDTAFIGNDSNFGIEIAIEDRGQTAGRDIELVKEDAGCGDAVSGQAAAQAIVADPSIVAVIGTTCSRTAVPAMTVFEGAALVMISPSSTAPSLTDPEHEDYGGEFFFRTAHNDAVRGAAVAQFACQELGVSTAATIHDGSPYAEQLQEVFAQDFAELCGGEVTAHEAINIGDTDFRRVLTAIAADGPELLLYPIVSPEGPLTTFSPEGPLITQQAQEIAGLQDTIHIGADGLKDQGFIDAAGDIAMEIGMYFSGPDLNFGGAYEDEFLPAYQELSGERGPIAPYHAHAYDAAMIIFDAIEAVAVESNDGTLFVPKDALRAFVANLTEFPGLTGDLTCDENGDCGSNFVSIAQLQGGEFVDVFTTRESP